MRNEDSLCEGGERIGIGPCAKCGATRRDHCRRPLPDPRIAQLETERDRLRAENERLRLNQKTRIAREPDNDDLRLREQEGE